MDASLRYIPPCLVALKTGSMTIEVGAQLTGSTIIAEHSTLFDVAKIRPEPWTTACVFITLSSSNAAVACVLTAYVSPGATDTRPRHHL